MIDPNVIIHSDDVIQHFGTKGMKWGVRKNYMSDKHALKKKYKQSLRKSKELYKGKKPDFWRRLVYKRKFKKRNKAIKKAYKTAKKDLKKSYKERSE